MTADPAIALLLSYRRGCQWLQQQQPAERTWEYTKWDELKWWEDSAKSDGIRGATRLTYLDVANRAVIPTSDRSPTIFLAILRDSSISKKFSEFRSMVMSHLLDLDGGMRQRTEKPSIGWCLRRNWWFIRHTSRSIVRNKLKVLSSLNRTVWDIFSTWECA